MVRFLPGLFVGLWAASAMLAWAAEDPVAAAPPSPPLDRSAPLEHLGFGSCLHQDRPQPIFSAINARSWDAFLMIGDNVYGDATPPALDELAEAYAVAAQAEGLNKLRASTPTLAIWDDHDYGANDAGAEFSGRLKAEELFHRFWHTPAGSVLRRREGLYYHETLGPEGQQVQVIFLDTRSFELASFQRTPLMRRGKSATSQMMRRIRTCSARPNGHGFWSAFGSPWPCVLWFLLFRFLRRATAGRLGACFPGSVLAFLSCLEGAPRPW